MYILQETLFSLEELQKIELKNRLPILFSGLDLGPYARELVSSSPQGAIPHDREAIMRTLLAAPLMGISTFTALHHRLEMDLRFRYQCGCLFSSIQTIVPIASGQAFLKYPDTVPAASGHHYRMIRPTAGTLCLKFNIDN